MQKFDFLILIAMSHINNFMPDVMPQFQFHYKVDEEDGDDVQH